MTLVEKVKAVFAARQEAVATSYAEAVRQVAAGKALNEDRLTGCRRGSWPGCWG